MAKNTLVQLLQEDNKKLREEVRVLEAENATLNLNITSYLNTIETLQEALLLNQQPIQKEKLNYLALLQTPVGTIPFSTRTKNILFIAGCYTLGDVVSQKISYFFSQRQCGYKTLIEIEEILETYGLKLGMGNDPLVCAYLNSKET